MDAAKSALHGSYVPHYRLRLQITMSPGISGEFLAFFAQYLYFFRYKLK